MGKPALLYRNDEMTVPINVTDIDINQRPSPHAGFDQGVHHGPIPPWAGILPPGPCHRFGILISPAIATLPPDRRKEICSIEQPAAFPTRDCPLDVEVLPYPHQPDVIHGVAQRQRSKLVDPLREGLHMRQDPVDGPVRPEPLSSGSQRCP